MQHKTVYKVAQSSPAQVGDGFFIRRPMPSGAIELGEVSPFLLLDHAGPTKFEPSNTPRGVEVHPHRGFETVTICYQGEIQHRDSGGNKGNIFPGDVQWMTAASGVVHEEKHSQAFTERGGTLEMIQLWINLPSRFKMNPPKYQEITKAQIPVVDLPNQGGIVRVIAGEYGGVKGAASTHTPMNLLDLRAETGAAIEIPVPNEYNAAVYVLTGEIALSNGSNAKEGEIVTFNEEGEGIDFQVVEGGKLLVLTGEPLNEAVASYGPFVMNTLEEIREAVADYQSGKMGVL